MFEGAAGGSILAFLGNQAGKKWSISPVLDVNLGSLEQRCATEPGVVFEMPSGLKELGGLGAWVLIIFAFYTIVSRKLTKCKALPTEPFLLLEMWICGFNYDLVVTAEFMQLWYEWISGFNDDAFTSIPT